MIQPIDFVLLVEKMRQAQKQLELNGSGPIEAVELERQVDDQVKNILQHHNYAPVKLKMA